MNLLSILITIPFLILFLTSCEIEPTDDQPTPVSPASTESPESSPSEPILKTELRSEMEPNNYAVQLSWTAQNEMCVIERIDKSGNSKVYPIETEKNGSMVDSAVAPGEVYTYWLWQEGSQGRKKQTSSAITIPKDAVFSGVVDPEKFKDLSTDGRLFLNKATVLTLGRPLNIKAVEVYSYESVIETYPSGQRGPQSTVGRTPGEIKIEAIRAGGNLRVVSRGEDGGDGKDGQTGFTGASGSKGMAALTGVNPSLTEAMQNAYRQFMTQLEAGSREWERVDPIARIPVFVCARPSGDGLPGVDGGPGMAGEDGSPGGDTSAIQINIADESDFSVDIQQQVGVGGAPGAGGLGGKGGLGGPGGDLDVGGRCTTVGKTAPAGNVGPSGRSGRPGRPGSLKPYCVRIGNRSQGNCNK